MHLTHRDIMVIYDTSTKLFRRWQEGDRPQCSACEITDLSYLVRVKPIMTGLQLPSIKLHLPSLEVSLASTHAGAN
jgi:hypothetical protein